MSIEVATVIASAAVYYASLAFVDLVSTIFRFVRSRRRV